MSDEQPDPLAKRVDALVSRARDGREVTREIPVVANPHVELVTLEATGGTPTAEQLAFRASWLGAR